MTDSIKSIGFYTRVIHHQIERTINTYLKEVELTKVQLDVLRFVDNCKKKNYNVKQRDIEDYFHISNPTVSGILDRLEQKGLIVRVKSEEDKRVRYIELTEASIRLYNTLQQTLQENEARLVEGISPKLCAEGMEFLRKVFDNVLKEKGDDA